MVAMPKAFETLLEQNRRLFKVERKLNLTKRHFRLYSENKL